MPADMFKLDAVNGSILGVVAFLLLVLDSFATLGERSFSQASETKLRYAASSVGGRVALKLLQHKDRTISTMRVLSILCQASLALILYYIIIASVTPFWLGNVVAVIVLLLAAVILGEIMPYAIGSNRPELTASYLALATRFFYYLLFPFTNLVGFFRWFASHVLKIKEKPDMSERDLQAVVTDVYDEGAIEKEEHDLIQNSLSFDDKTIARVMTPLKNVVYVDSGMTVAQIEHLFIENNYSRVPFFDKDSGQVEGILFQKDFYEMLLTEKKPVATLIKPALFFPDSINASLALKRLQRFRQHIAIVRSQADGKVVGLITVEDLVEEIVGEIEDEYDAEDIQKQQAQELEKKSELAAKAEKRILESNFQDTAIFPRNDDYDEDYGPDDDKKDKGADKK